MDKEQEELQFIGLFGMHKEAIKIILSWTKIFTQISLALILLSFTFLSHDEITGLIFMEIEDTRRSKISDALLREWITYWLFRCACYTFLLVFSLLSTSAVVYSIACMYTAREVTFTKVMSVVPKVWKRLLVTFSCMFSAFFVYNLIAGLVIYIWSRTIGDSKFGDEIHWASWTIGAEEFGDVLFWVVYILYLVGFVYMTMTWQLASVVSVLETSFGFKATLKRKDLIKGKGLSTLGIFLMLSVSFGGLLYLRFGVYRFSMGMWKKVVLGLCLLLLLTVFLFGLVIQTALYLVSKSEHHENIDKSSLSDHLEGHLGDYEPLKGESGSSV